MFDDTHVCTDQNPNTATTNAAAGQQARPGSPLLELPKNNMGGIRKKKTKRGVEHHKQNLEQTLEAPETYGIRVRPATIVSLRTSMLPHLIQG